MQPSSEHARRFAAGRDSETEMAQRPLFRDGSGGRAPSEYGERRMAVRHFDPHKPIPVLRMAVEEEPAKPPDCKQS
jgi:hypothetical protein